MVLKDIFGKLGRFIRGRLAAAGDGAAVGVPASCLHRYPVEKSDTGRLAIVYSGDGGWARLTTHLAKRLQSEGIPVAGIDSMHYFWTEKHAESAAEDLAELIGEFATTPTGAEEIVLLGYSMGADVLPSIARQLPEDLLARVGRIVLMSPSHRVLLKFRFIGWLGCQTPEDRGAPLRPDIEALSATIPISCFAGTKERDTLVRELGPEIAKTEFLPGGHHYNSDYETLAERVIAHLRGG